MKLDPLVIVSAFFFGLIVFFWMFLPTTTAAVCYPDGTFTESTGLRLRAHGANVCESAP